MKKEKLHLLPIMIAVIMVFSSITVSAQIETNWQSKISDELLEVMENKTDADLIPIYIWLQDIDEDVITKAMIEENGMDPAVYENDARFMSEIVPSIEASIVSRVGYEDAHDSIQTEYVLDQNGAYHDDSMSLVDRAIQAKTKEYIMARRTIVKREYTNVVDNFVEKYINSDRKIIDMGQYISLVIVEATKSDIQYYASLPQVNSISLFVNYELTDYLAITQNQIGTDDEGTKGETYNSGNGFKGTGIKIGILENKCGKFNSNNPHLAPLAPESDSSRLQYFNYATSVSDGVTTLEPELKNHATVVTCIIVGQSVEYENIKYEGVVPLATVYQISINNVLDMKRAFEKLAELGVTVINCSAGISYSEAHYSDLDKTIDKLINSTGITFVAAAGNDANDYGNQTGIVGSPGNALNAITVGAAQTKSSPYTASIPQYIVHNASSYITHPALPNKPDIVAPGVNFRVAVSERNGTVYFFSSIDGINGVSGTSFAAPLVTGLVAQIQQAGALAFSRYPALVKSVLVTGADPTLMGDYYDSNAANNEYLKERSGAGLVNAERSVTIADTTARWNFSYFSADNRTVNTTQQYYSQGQRIRVSVCFLKTVDNNITSTNDYNNINLKIYNANNASYYAENNCSNDNAVLIDYTIPVSGYYRFEIKNTELYADQYLYYYYSWYVIDN